MKTGRRVGMVGGAVACAMVIALILLAGSSPVRAGGRQDARPPIALKPVAYESLKHDVSPRLDSMQPLEPVAADEGRVRINKKLPRRLNATRREAADWTDAVAQTEHPLAPMPSPIVNFDGVYNVLGYAPPDTQGAVGPNHYVQWVNVQFAIYTKSGTKVYPAGSGFAAGKTIWTGFGAPCEIDDGDPITLYDKQAGRWLMAQFALPNYPNAPFYECLAVSQTSDPTGQWYRYVWKSPSNTMNDYPHFGVWPDGYYMSVNQFASGTGNWAGQGVAVFDRAKMIAGVAAPAVYFDLFALDPNLGGMLPSDLDGATAPPSGSPNYFIEIDDDAWGYSPDQLQLFKFHVDWANQANSTFTRSTPINLTAAGLAFDSNMCGNSSGHCIPQKGTSAKVDALSDRLMYRLAYRNFGSHEALIVNHTVDVNNTDRAGIRWYEVRNPGDSATVFQAGTYSPDTDHRWMGSIAMDSAGNMALGYSVSSTSLFPSIRYAGRLAGDPLNTLPQAEVTLMAGSGAQTASHGRWGDYSMMSVDPTDDCTFWYTQEYYATTGSSPWRTRIGSFKFPSCGLASAPGMPTGLTGSATGSTLTLSWVAPTSATPATSYILEAGSAPSLSDLVTFDTGNALTTFTANGVATGQYFLRVRAKNAFGTGGPSTELRVIVGAVVPSAPSALSGSAIGSTLTLSWTAPTMGGATTAYIIEVGSGPGLADLANFSTGSTAVVFKAYFVPNGRYFLRVRAANGAGSSGTSNEVFVVVGPLAPPSPAGLTWSSAGSSIALSWTQPIPYPTPLAYIIEAGSAPGGSDLATFSTASTATSYSTAGVGSGTYFLRVLATNTGGTSGPSNEVRLVVGCTGVPGAPTGLHTNSNSGGTVQFGWTAPNAVGSSNGPTTYILEAGSSTGASNLANVDLGGTGTTFATSGVGVGTYFVRVKAKNLCGASTASNEFTLVVR